MDTLKQAVGLGKTGENPEGTEPVSGEKGEGTVAQPFDRGNDTEATQTANTTEKEGVTGTQSNEAVPDSGAEEKSKSSWLKSANLFGSKDKSDEQPEQNQASAGAERAAGEGEKLPPNHLGVDVPQGQSIDLAGPNDEAPGKKLDTVTSNQASADTSSASQPAEPNVTESRDAAVAGPSSASASGSSKPSLRVLPGSRPDKSGSRGSMMADAPRRGSLVNPSAIPVAGGKPVGHGTRENSSPSSTAVLPGSRSSLSPSDASGGRRPSMVNPGAIPIAGGKPVGHAATERRKSRAIDTTDLPELDKHESPNPVTEANTLANAEGPAQSGEEKLADAPAATTETTTAPTTDAKTADASVPDAPAADGNAVAMSRKDADMAAARNLTHNDDNLAPDELAPGQEPPAPEPAKQERKKLPNAIDSTADPGAKKSKFSDKAKGLFKKLG